MAESSQRFFTSSKAPRKKIKDRAEIFSMHILNLIPNLRERLQKIRQEIGTFHKSVENLIYGRFIGGKTLQVMQQRTSQSAEFLILMNSIIEDRYNHQVFE